MTSLLSFLYWYFLKGPVLLFSLWKNLLTFLIRLFNFVELSITILSPWKRDISPKDWLGFQPAKSLHRLSMNLFSRFMGLIVRTLVLFSGAAVVIVFLLSGIIAFPGWFLGVPLLIFMAVSIFIRGDVGPVGIVVLLFAAASAPLPLLAVLFREQSVPIPRSRRELFQASWFPRVLGRLGIRPKLFHREEWESDEAFEERLSELNISKATFDGIVSHEALAAELRLEARRPFSRRNLRKTIPIGKGWQYGFTVHLDRYAVDLSRGDTSEYSSLHLFGREDELRLATLIMRRDIQNGFLLIGNPGIGKKTFLHALVRKIREGDMPEFENLRFLSLDLGIALGDAANRGIDRDNFLRSLFYEAAYAGNVVLIIDGIDAYFGGRNRPDLSAVFSEFLALPSFRLIGTIGNAGYDALAHRDSEILKLLEPVYLGEPSATDTLLILLNILGPIERKRTIFTWEALRTIVDLSGQYDWDIPYPEKAVDLMNGVLAAWETDPQGDSVTRATVESFVSMKTGIPVGTLGEDEKERLLRLEEILHYRVVGQDDAVRQVSEALRRARAGFGDPKRPLGSFLFLGPTGVGKTETAKALAEAYFGDENRMVRLDMSEYQSSDSVERLIGSGESGEEGRLSGIMKEHPFSVVLLDEVEKAYPRALDLFLQVLDEGFVTDAEGKKINFRKSVIIATSNASSILVSELLGHGATADQSKAEIVADLVKNGSFRPEFLNRFDGLILFSPLSDAELVRIADLKLRALALRIKERKNIDVSFDEGVARAVVAGGYEPAFGARSLNRYIEDRIEDVIVRRVIEGRIAEGGRIKIAEADLDSFEADTSGLTASDSLG